jgi:hypothetical protein
VQQVYTEVALQKDYKKKKQGFRLNSVTVMRTGGLENLMSRGSAFALVAASLFFAGISFGGSILYENALPVSHLNTPGPLRSNIAFSESDPTAEFDGTDVVLSTSVSGANQFDLTSVTTWSVASILGEPLGDEFSEIALYYRPEGGTWEILEEGTPDQFFESGSSTVDQNSNPDITSTNVGYTGLVQNYESTTSAGTFYPLWENTFDISNLNLILQAGVDYQFAVWGVGIDPNAATGFGYWYNSFSNAALSGNVTEDNTSGTYLRCSFSDLSGPCATESPVTDGTWNKGANMNIVIDGIAVPESSSVTLVGVGLLGLWWRARRRLKC